MIFLKLLLNFSVWNLLQSCVVEAVSIAPTVPRLSFWEVKMRNWIWNLNPILCCWKTILSREEKVDSLKLYRFIEISDWIENVIKILLLKGEFLLTYFLHIKIVLNSNNSLINRTRKSTNTLISLFQTMCCCFWSKGSSAFWSAVITTSPKSRVTTHTLLNYIKQDQFLIFLEQNN